MREGLALTGRVLKVENRPYRNDQGQEVPRMIVHILADVDVFECSLGRDYKGPIPEKGQTGTWPVQVRVFKRRGGDVGMSVDLAGEAVAVGGEDEDVPAARALTTVG